MKRLSPVFKLKIHADHWILAAASVFLLLFAFAEWQYRVHGGSSHTQTFYRAFLLVIICLLFYLGGLLTVQRTHDPRIIKRLMVLFFFLYLYLILTFTLLDPSLGRGKGSVYENGDNVREYYMTWFVNFRPLRSIHDVYIQGFLHGYVKASYVLLNLVGNVCAFMPFAYFLPLFFKKQGRWYLFLPTMLLLVALIEALQLAFMVGSCDVDDLILNVGGAFLMFLILKIPLFQKWILKINAQPEAK